MGLSFTVLFIFLPNLSFHLSGVLQGICFRYTAKKKKTKQNKTVPFPGTRETFQTSGLANPGSDPSFALDKLCEPSTSLVAQMVKNPPAIQETRVRSLSQEDFLEKEMAT